MTATLVAALAYAQRGWPVFPCQPNDKPPYGALAPNGFKDATTDPAVIRRWFSAAPNANLAIATGAPGPDVLDVEGPDKPAGCGFPALNRLQRAGLCAGAEMLVTTPSRGVHLYYSGTGQRCGSLPAHHVDLKATGGYVLAAPSVVAGKPYIVEERRDDSAGRLDWSSVTALLAPPPIRRIGRPYITGRIGGIKWLADWLARQPDGNRNKALFWAACRAVEAGDDPDALTDAAASIGLTPLAIRATIESARARYPG